MIRYLRCASAGALFVVALALPALASAKPPDLPEDGTFTVKQPTSPPSAAVEVLPMPRQDSEITCPYLRQQRNDRHASSIAPTEMGHDVLDNLERLKRADQLLETAKNLARDGLFGEALLYCVEAADLCPGSPCAQRATDTLLELTDAMLKRTLTSLEHQGRSEESAEPPTCPYCPRDGKPIREIVPNKKNGDEDDHGQRGMHSIEYEVDIGAKSDGELRMSADCPLGGSVYHLRYGHGNLAIWKTPDAGK